LLLTEAAFARFMGAALSGLFLTALVKGLGGGTVEVGVAVSAGHIGATGMLLANPVLNRLGSRRKFCLIGLGAVRALRVVIAALPMLIYIGVGRESLIWPVVACVVASFVFGMPSEIARRSWIGDLVTPAKRGEFFSRRVMIALLTQMVVLLAGGRFLDWYRGTGREELVGIAIIVGTGAAMGWIGWLLLWRAPEPQMSLPRRRTGLVRSLWLPLRHPRFRAVVLLGGAHYLAVGVCAGYFHLYMREHLRMTWFYIAAVDTVGLLLASAGAMVFGAWADRAGAKRVLIFAALAKSVFPLLWILVTPAFWPMAFAVVPLRAFNSATVISWLRLSLNLSPARNRMAYLAMHEAMMGAGIAVGGLAGAGLAGVLEGVQLGSIAGFQIVPLHVLFLISTVLRLAVVPFLRLIREPHRTFAQGRRAIQIMAAGPYSNGGRTR